jgi:hypothetical protein
MDSRLRGNDGGWLVCVSPVEENKTTRLGRPIERRIFPAGSDPRQSVPSDCVFIRFRYPGGGIFTSAGIVQFRQRADGVTACKAFVEGHGEPIELQMNFPSESSQTFASPTFAADHVVAQSRWLRWKRAVGAWWH